MRRLIGHALSYTGDLPGAIDQLDEAIRHAQGAVPALVMEMQVTRAELAATRGDDVMAALAAVRAVRAAAEASGAQVNAVWAQSVEASLLARLDPDAAVTAAAAALDASRAAQYSACKSVNLHTLAGVAIVEGDLALAARHTCSTGSRACCPEVPRASSATRCAPPQC